MDFSEASLILRSIPRLKNLSNANQKLLAFTSQLQTYEDGEVVFHIHDPATDVFIVVEGEVEQIIMKGDTEIHKGTIARHHLFGEMAVIQGITRLVTTRAKGRTKVLRIEGDMFLKMSTDCPESALAVMKELAQKITTLMNEQ